MSALAYKRTNVYEKADEKLLKEIFDYAEGYKVFLDEGKTEREACAWAKAEAIKNGYKPFKFGQKLQKRGDGSQYTKQITMSQYSFVLHGFSFFRWICFHYNRFWL